MIVVNKSRYGKQMLFLQTRDQIKHYAKYNLILITRTKHYRSFGTHYIP